jgi:hypothetical protein
MARNLDNKAKERIQRAIDRGVISPYLICDENSENLSAAEPRKKSNNHMAPRSLSPTEMFRGPSGD